MLCMPLDGYEGLIPKSEAVTGDMVVLDQTDPGTGQIFGIDYPLPKMDMLAVHEFVSHTLIQYWKAPQECH